MKKMQPSSGPDTDCLSEESGPAKAVKPASPPATDHAAGGSAQTDLDRTDLERFFSLSMSLLATASIEDGHWKRVNPAFTRLLGWSEAELLAMPFFDLVHPDDLDRTRQATARLAEGTPLTQFEHRLRCRDGSYRWIAWETWYDQEEGLMYCTGRDVTQQIAAREKLRESEEKYQALFSSMTEGFAVGEVIADQNGDARDFRFIRINEAFTRQTGLGEDILNRPITQVLPGLEWHWIETYCRVGVTGSPVRFENFNENTRRHYHVYCYSPARGQFAILFRDITEEKRTEKSLRESITLYRSLAANFPSGGVFVVDHDLRYLLADGEALRMAGMTPADLEGKSVTEALDSELAALYIPHYRKALSGETFVLEHESHGRSYISRGVPLRNDEGRIFGALAVSYDVTDRQRAEKELRRSREALRRSNEHLEQKVIERTTDLRDTVAVLQEEIQQRTQAEEELRKLNTQLNIRAAQLRKLTGEITMTGQRERRRLAGILHDGLQQYLVSAKVQMENISPSLPDERLQNRGNGILKILNESIRITRSLSTELSPPALHQGGISAGLEWLARWMRDAHDFDVALSVDAPDDLSDDIRVILFESVRELLFNIVKHAGVSHARVDLCQTMEGLQVNVSDGGNGFDPERLDPARNSVGGMGLFSIRERVALLGGRFDIDSAPGKGSRFSLFIPAIQPSEAIRQ